MSDIELGPYVTIMHRIGLDGETVFHGHHYHGAVRFHDDRLRRQAIFLGDVDDNWIRLVLIDTISATMRPFTRRWSLMIPGAQRNGYYVLLKPPTSTNARGEQLAWPFYIYCSEETAMLLLEAVMERPGQEPLLEGAICSITSQVM